MSIEETIPFQAGERIEALMKIHPKGYDLSLGRIRDLLGRLGNPHNKLPPVIHFAGTNGKGSTIAFVQAILEAAGLSVHVHTSPHLVNWHERYRIGVKGGRAQLVDDGMLCEAIDRVANANGGNPITVFEVMTAVAFVLFSENPADVCLIEVGLGGRLDSTNVMDKVDLSVITPVSIDHKSHLGDTLQKIAFEKAGIIKRGIPVVVGPQEDEALEVIVRQAAKNGADVEIADHEFSAMRENGRLVYQDQETLLDLTLPRLPGEHQIANASIAVAACRRFCGRRRIELTNTMLDRGLLDARWPARLQHLTHGMLVDAVEENCDLWLDGGHNPAAGATVAHFLGDLEERDSRPVTLICGMLDTKDTVDYFRQFETLVERVITVPITSSEAGIDPEFLADRAEEAGLPAISAPSLKQALNMIDRAEPSRVLICGSLYLAGEALEQNGTSPR